MDIRTFLIIITLANFLTSLFLFYYSINRHQRNKLLEIYSIGRLFMGFAWLLLSQRGYISNGFSVGLGNIFLIIGIAIEMMIISSYQKVSLHQPLRKYIGIGIVASLLFSFSVNKADNVRVAVASYLLALLVFYGVFHVLRQKNQGKMHYLLGYIYLSLSIILLARGIIASFFRLDLSLLTVGPIQSLSFVSFLLTTYIGVILLLLQLKENDDRSLQIKALELDEANKELAITLKSKDQFISIIAHDLRGPMGSLAQMSELLTDSSVKLTTQERDELNKSIYRGAAKTYELLENLLNWARSQSQTFKVNLVPVELQHLISQVVFQLQGLANDKNISIHNNTGKHTWVMADNEMIQVVVRNLISNAIKFTPVDGHIFIDSYFDNNFVRVTVRDTGKGIPFDVQQHLFKADFTHTTLGTNNERGTGFGLKICKEFVEKNNGKIELASVPNQGSVFSFTLPPVLETVN